MRKTITFILLFMLIYLWTPSVKADSNYKAYEDLSINTGKILEDLTNTNY